jgi:gliding motility-associated-like protein
MPAMFRLSLTAFLCLLGLLLVAQPANDDCGTAIALPETDTYCSGAAAFTTAGATTSLDQSEYAICIDERLEIKDVWFSFRARRNSVTIRVVGAVPGNERGALVRPQFSLIGGDCGSDENLACRSPFGNTGDQNGGSLIYNELVRGEIYHILVGARDGNEGSFELCVEQFDAVPEPSSDCVTGVVLCDKSPFSVQKLEGRGVVNDDMMADDVVCGGPPQELNSTWYKWTCDQPGTLSFTITPLGAAPNEDIDFTLYELTSGLEGCGDRRVLRHMYSGEGGSAPNYSVCLGPTGIRDGESDRTENCGCTIGDNNFIESIEMEAGKSYALAILNFSGSGDGFSIEFGGTGTFLGPEPELVFSTAETCVGDPVTFEDRSTSVDGIASWEWDFGPDAQPRNATGPGPHEVSFGRAGNPSVTLAITTTRKCVEYITTSEVNVVCCENQFAGLAEVIPENCPASMDGEIRFSGRSIIDETTLAYAWSTGATSAAIDGLGAGSYTVTISDGSGCSADFIYQVEGPEPIRYDTLIMQPDCAGGTNGALTLTALSGGAGNFTYSLNGGPFSANNTLSGIPVSTVNVRIRDGNGCEEEQDIFVDERQLGLRAGTTGFVEPTCHGGSDGSLLIEIANGIPDFAYDFGTGFQPVNVRQGVAAGAYRVAAVDSKGCTGEFDLTVSEPPPLLLSMSSDSSSCYRANDGSIFATASGGRPGYAFTWSDSAVGSDRINLAAGTYAVRLTDSVGCSVHDTVLLNDPEAVVASVIERLDLVCYEGGTGQLTLGVDGGTPEYAYSLDNITFQSSPLLDSLAAGNYRLYVRDANGCLDSLSATLTQPRKMELNLATDVRIILGYDTTLMVRSNYFPMTYRWGPDSLGCLSGNCDRVHMLPLRNQLVFVEGTNGDGCTDTAFVNFTVVEDIPTFIPNIFTPNEDGLNDFFTVFGGRAIAEVELLHIYDRWGNLVYAAPAPFPANDPRQGWDGTLNGKPVNLGAYVYHVEVSYINGRVEGYRGDVTVVR